MVGLKAFHRDIAGGISHPRHGGLGAAAGASIEHDQLPGMSRYSMIVKVVFGAENHDQIAVRFVGIFAWGSNFPNPGRNFPNRSRARSTRRDDKKSIGRVRHGGEARTGTNWDTKRSIMEIELPQLRDADFTYVQVAGQSRTRSNSVGEVVGKLWGRSTRPLLISKFILQIVLTCYYILLIYQLGKLGKMIIRKWLHVRIRARIRAHTCTLSGGDQLP